jgi:hypothetical protein
MLRNDSSISSDGEEVFTDRDLFDSDNQIIPENRFWYSTYEFVDILGVHGKPTRLVLVEGSYFLLRKNKAINSYQFNCTNEYGNPGCPAYGVIEFNNPKNLSIGTKICKIYINHADGCPNKFNNNLKEYLLY